MNRVLIFGDSIAYGKWDHEGGYVDRLRKYFDNELNIGKKGNNQVYNLGIPGDTTRRLLERIEQELKMRLQEGDDLIVILQVGLNDVNHANAFHNEQVPQAEFINNINKLKEIVSKYTNRIIVVGITQIYEPILEENFPKFKGQFLNSEVKEYYKLQKDYCMDNKIEYIDLFDKFDPKDFIDGIHPGAEGHKEIFQEILQKLKI